MPFCLDTALKEISAQVLGHINIDQHLNQSKTQLKSFYDIVKAALNIVFSALKQKRQTTTFGTVEFQCQLLPGLRLLGQPLLQFLLLLQELIDFMIVTEGLPHQLSLGHPGMLKLREKQERDVRAEQLEGRLICIK